MHANGDGTWCHLWGMTLCYKLKMHRGIDEMFAFSFDLCTWINKDTRTQTHHFIICMSSSNPLLGHTRSQGRCWAAIQLSCHPGPSGHVLKREVEELDSKGQHGQQTVLMPHTYKQEKGPYSVCVSRSGNVWNQCEGSEAGPTLSLAGLIQASGWLPMIRMKARSLVVFSNYSIFHQWSAQSTTLPLLLSDELMSCCAVS